MGVSQNWRYLFGRPYNKDYSIFGSILGSPHFGKLPSGLENDWVPALTLEPETVSVWVFVHRCIVFCRKPPEKNNWCFGWELAYLGDVNKTAQVIVSRPAP